MKHRPLKPPKFALDIVDKVKGEQAKQVGSQAKGHRPVSAKQSNSKLNKTIDQAISRMKQASDIVAVAKQELNADLFLQQQKQKRLEYARNLNEQFEKQRKLREKKVYKEPVVEQQNPKKYLNEMPDLRKYFKDPSADDPFVIETHDRERLQEVLKQLNAEELRKAEQDSFGRLETDKGLSWERNERLAENPQKSHFATLSKSGEVEMKSDLLPTEEAEQLANALVLIASNRHLYSRMVIDREELGLESSSGKLYAFRMFKRGQPFTVVVDSYLQCEKFENNAVVRYSRCFNKNTFWLGLLEKAYKKLKRCGQRQLQQFSLQSILNDLANLDCEVIKFSPEAIILNQFFVSLHLLLRNQCVIALCRKGEMPQSNALEGRVYLVKQVRLFKDARSCKVEILNPWRSKVLKEDGSQLLTADQLLKSFNRLVVVKSYPQDWCGVSLFSNFFSYGLPSSSSTEWTKYNQHSLLIAKPCCLRIIMKPQEPFPDQYGFLLFRAEPQDLKITTMNLERLISNAKSSNPNSAAVSIALEKGSYFVVPYTHTRSHDSYVFFTIELYCNRNDSLIFGKSRYTEVAYVNISTDKDKILAELQQKEVFEKPKTEKIIEPKSRINRPLQDCITPEDIRKMGMDHPRIAEFLYPGMLHQFIVKDHVVVQEQPTQKAQRDAAPVNSQLAFEQQNEIFKCLIGVDAYTEEVNRGLMDDAMEMLEEQVDLALFGLGDQGFQALLVSVMEQPIIRLLNVSSNELHDSSITYLAYYLEKTGHTELKQLNVSDNKLTQASYSTLLALKQRLPCLQIIRAQRNPGLTRDMLKGINSTANKSSRE